MAAILDKLNKNIFVRNLILALCAIIVFVFIMHLLLNLFTRHKVYKQVPDFSNMTVEQARREARKSSVKILVNDSLYVPIYDPGVVLTQMPESGTNVKSGRRIFVTINSYRQKMVRIPYVTGNSLRQAKNDLEVAGLEIDNLVYRDDIATNYVIEERYNGQAITPNSNLEAEQGSGITLVVGMKKDESVVSVPKVVGFPLNEAKSRLWEIGLNVGSVVFDDDITLLNRSEAKVYAQTPEQGTRTHLGSQVTVRLSIDENKIEQGGAASDRAARTIISTQNREDEQE